MKKEKDILKKSYKHKLPPEWEKAFDDATKCPNPLRDMDHTRIAKARAAYVCLVLAGTADDLPKDHRHAKEFRKALKKYL